MFQQAPETGDRYMVRNPSLSDRDFARLSSFIEGELGIKMPPAKRVMLESRLFRRLRIAGMSDYGAYLDWVFGEEGRRSELVHMIDAVTTNKTDFFREADHFEYLSRQVLPLWRPARPGASFRAWSAGCSTGEEPYTLGMVFEERRAVDPSFVWSLVATDISSKVLQHAVNGVYDADRVEPVPAAYKKRYLLKSKDPSKDLVRVKPNLRSKVEFRRVNLMDEQFGFREPFDIIFCRNVIIYFDRPTQERLVRKFCRALRPGGYVFLGHSETLTGMDVPLRSVAPTVYRMDAER